MIELLLNPLFKMLGFDYKNKRVKDRVLLEEFLLIVPSDSASIMLLKNRDIAVPIYHQVFTPLDNIADLWDAPDKKFQVRVLEKLKNEFVASLDIFLNEYAKNSSASTPGMLSIDFQDFETPRKFKAHERLNNMARDAYYKYSAFVETARSEI